MITQAHQSIKTYWFKVFMSLVVSLLLLASTQSYSLTNKQFLASMLPDNCHFSGDFSQTKKIKALPKPLASQGDFLYSCKLGLIWETKVPIKESLVFSTEKLNFVVKDEQTTENLESVQHDFLAKLLLGLMAADIRVIEEEFELEIGESDAQQTSLTLVPKGKMIKEAIQSVELQKDSNKKNLIITITDINGQITKINTKEVERYSDDKDFKKRCTIQQYHSDACALLLDPERVRDQ